MEQCENCIWSKTIRPVAMLAFTCKGTDKIRFIDNSFPCEFFEHREFPKKMGYEREEVQ